MNESAPNIYKYKKENFFVLFISIAILLLSCGVYLLFGYFSDTITQDDSKIKSEIPEGIMILIEYKDTVGLANFVNEMYTRNIPGLLLVSPDFVEQNCEDVKDVLKHNVEIIGSNPSGEFWDMPYEEQYDAIKDMKDRIEACTGEPLRIVGSRYMASDENTVKAAEELRIPYVIARGTTGTKASVYKPEEYDVKILSISNIEIATFKYGSLCDYSFFERAGTPDDMLAELERAISPLSEKEIERYGEFHHVTPVSHTNIGGYLEPWMSMWTGFWDSADIEWVGLDDFMSDADWEIPMWQVPINKNAPYTPEKIRPLTAYEDVEKVENPCAVIDLPEADSASESNSQDGSVLHVFHNNTGPMCLDALEYFETLDLEVVEHLTTDDDFSTLLAEYKSGFSESEGYSSSFGYYPIIFYKDRAFSGFDEDTQEDLDQIVK